jgi:hypothetical protein
MKKSAKTTTSSLFFLLTGFVLSLAAGHPATVATGQIDPPANAAGLSDLVQFTPAEVQALKAGHSVSKLLQSGSDHEIAVAGAVWINAPCLKVSGR